MGIAQGDPDGVIGELVDVGHAVTGAVIRRPGVQGTDVVQLIAHIGGKGATAIGQGPDRLQICRTGQPLTDQRRVRRLVDGHTGQQLRRILIELHTAVVAGRDLLAAIQEGGGEVGAQAPDRDHLAAAVETLGRQTRQARQRFGDGDVRQLADVFGRHDLDDGGVVALGGDRALDRGPDAGHDDFIDFLRLGFVLRRLLGDGRARARQNADCAEGSAGEEARAPGDLVVHHHSPLGRRFSREASGFTAK